MTQAKFRKGAMVPGVEDYAAYTIDAAVDPKVSSSGWWTSKIHVFGDEELRDRILTMLNSPLRDWQVKVHNNPGSNETVLTLISPSGQISTLQCRMFNGNGVRLVVSHVAINFARDFGVFANPFKADEGTTIDLRPGSANYTALEEKIGELECEREKLRDDFAKMAVERDSWKAELTVVRKQRDDLRDNLARVTRDHDNIRAEAFEVRKYRDTWKRACRENYEAFCAMRNDINEMIGNMASAESTLRDGPEMQYECEAVATAVRDYVDRAKLLADEYNELRREYAAYRDTAEQREKLTLGNASIRISEMTKLCAGREQALENKVAELEKANEVLRSRSVSAAAPQAGPTGRTRFRTGWFGRQVLQIEERRVQHFNADGVAIVDLTWRDANHYDTMTARVNFGEGGW